jgi:hypothetical protein
LRILSAYGGQSCETAEDYVEGGPEMMLEIAHSSVAIDMHQKWDDYQRAGVCEYVVLCIAEKELHWFDFRTGRPIRPNRQSVSRSWVFPGLWIHVQALLDQDSSRLMEVVQRGPASPEHACFVKHFEAEHRRRLRS